MITPSKAAVLSNEDGLSSLERAAQQDLMLGLFLPIQNCGWTASTAPRSTTWEFDYNAQLAVRADELGFDLTFGLGLWPGKGGLGGKVRFWETSLDPLITVAGLAAITNNILLISTVHVLYGWHPLHLAKFGATLSHMTKGRWGLNIVTGYNPGEFQKFGKEQIEHDARYDMAAEFTDFMLKLWTMEENLTIEGDHWHMTNAFCTPKPNDKERPVIVNAAASPKGLEFAANHCDIIFTTSPVGADIDKALEAFPEHVRTIKNLARDKGREVKVVVNPLIICRDTEKEVKKVYRTIIEYGDHEAMDGIMSSQRSGDNRAWRGHLVEQKMVGGNIQIFGTPEQVVDRCIQIKRAGVDGIHLSFFDFAPELEFFGERVLPLLKQAGLRK